MLKAKGVVATKGKAKWDFRALMRRWNLSQACEWGPGLERSRREERTPKVEGTGKTRNGGWKVYPVMRSMIQEVSWGWGTKIRVRMRAGANWGHLQMPG